MSRTRTTSRTTTSTRNRTRTRLLVLVPLALVLGTGGTATAAALITGAQIQDNSVAGRDLTNGSVTGLDVKDASLTAADFTGSVQGPAGPAGPAGAQGPAGVSGLQYVTDGISLPAGQAQTWGALCPPGKRVVGGGVSSTSPYDARIVESAPLDDGVGWWVGLRNQGSSAFSAYAWAVCAVA